MSGRPGLLLLGALLFGAACHKKPATPKTEPVAVTRTGAEGEADLLGAEAFELIDRSVDYRGSHRGRYATSFRQLGIDSLTPRTVRRMRIDGDTPTVTVAFRRPGGHVLRDCSAGQSVLEEGSLTDGHFTVSCTSPAGQTSYLVGGRRSTR